jgi:hypothetical protein
MNPETATALKTIGALFASMFDRYAEGGHGVDLGEMVAIARTIGILDPERKVALQKFVLAADTLDELEQCPGFPYKVGDDLSGLEAKVMRLGAEAKAIVTRVTVEAA